jgi:UrcA family protein
MRVETNTHPPSTQREIAMRRLAPASSSRPRAFAAFGAITAAALLAAPTLASAGQPTADAPQMIVYYSFADLSTDRGTHALYERIVSAARTVCPGSYSPDLAKFAASKQCQQEAVAHAIAQIGNARLAAVYRHAVGRRG